MDARPNAYIFIHGIIPRDMSPFSSRRARIREVNMLVRSECNLRDRFVYIEPASELCGPGGYLNEELYWGDNLHLVEAGNEIMARSISEAVRKRQSYTGAGTMGRPNPVMDSYAIGEFESIGATPSHRLPPTSSPPGDGFPPLPPPPLTSRTSSSPATSPWGRISVPRISCPSAFPPLPLPLPPLPTHVDPACAGVARAAARADAARADAAHARRGCRCHVCRCRLCYHA